MSRLPSLTAREIIRVLKRSGFIEDRKKGSHLVMFNPQTGARTVVPIHSGNIKRSLTYAIIRDTQMTVEDFMKMLR